MKEKDARLMILEYEINLVQGDLIKARSQCGQTLESKEGCIKILHDMVKNIENTFDERVNEMEEK